MPGIGRVDNEAESETYRVEAPSSQHGRQGQATRSHGHTDSGEVYDVPDAYSGLDELAASSPVKDVDEDQLNQRGKLEDVRREEKSHRSDQVHSKREQSQIKEPEVSRFATQVYAISYLVLFSIFGTLARLGLQAITFYPGAPIVFSELWANVGGSLFFGFLGEDRMLFREEWGTPKYHQAIEQAKRAVEDEEKGSSSKEKIDLAAAKKAHGATKKTIPLYIGLATGFCGSFTSFSSFIRDAFLALSNSLPTPLDHPSDYPAITTTTNSTVPRNGGYSFMALLAVVITTVSLSLSALHIGAHLAILTEKYTPTLPFRVVRRIIDPLSVFLAFGCWLGAIILTILPPDRNSPDPETWRGRALFALVFAPIGCLLRFYASQLLNPKVASFPLGTFAVNVFGTIVLGMSWDLQHVPLGGIVGCQVLQGIEDGFCGCLTTVSTWVGELAALRRSHAYKYGAASIVVSLCFLIVIMGSMQWTIGFAKLQCSK